MQHSGKDQSNRMEPSTLASSLAHYVDDCELVPPSVKHFSVDAGADGGGFSSSFTYDPFVESCRPVLLKFAEFGAKTFQQILVSADVLLASEKDKHALKRDVDGVHRAHMREMLFLLSFLQRPRYFYEETLYAEVLGRLKAMRLEKELIDHLKRVYSSYADYTRNAPSVMLDVLLQLISMYAETLLLYAKALDEEKDAPPQEAANSHSTLSGGIEPTDLCFLYTFAFEAGKEDRGRAAQWGKSAVCVTVFLMHCSKSMLSSDNSQLLLRCCTDFGRSEDPSIATLVVPQCVLYCFAHPPENDAGHFNGFLHRASAALATTRVLDMTTNSFFRRDSAESSVALNYVNDFLREMLCRFFDFVQSELLVTCHLDTLLSLCKSMAIYGVEWEQRPTALAALVAIAQHNMASMRVVIENIKAVNAKLSEARLRAANLPEGQNGSRDHEALWMQTLGIEEAKNSTSAAALPIPDARASRSELAPAQGSASNIADDSASTSMSGGLATIAKALGQQFQSEVDYELYTYSVFNYVASADLRFLTNMESVAKYFTVSQKQVPLKSDDGARDDDDSNNRGRSDSSNNSTRSEAFNVLAHSIDLLERYLSRERIRALSGTVRDREDPQYGSTVCQAAFVESTINLLLSLTFHCHTDLRGLSALVGQDILAYCKRICELILPEVNVSAFTQDCVYNFVGFFCGGLGDLQCLANSLLREDVCALVGTDVHAVGTATAQMCVYSHLCSHSEIVSKERIFLSLCAVPKGAIEQTLEGGTFFLLASAHLQSLRRATFYAEKDLSTFVYDVLLQNLSSESLSVFVGRWCEGLSFLLKELFIGVPTSCGESVGKHLQFVIEVLTIILLSTQAYREMAQCSVKVLQVDNAATLFYALLSLLFESNSTLDCAKELTELLLLFVHRTAEDELLYALRSTCTQNALLSFAARIRTVLQDRAGTRDNVYRLRLLRSLQTTATSVFDYLVGPRSLPKDNNVQELSDLPFCRTLCTIMKEASADYLERALATLIQRDISTNAIQTTRLISLLSDMEWKDALKESAFAAAAISFVDVIAMQHLSKESASPDGSLTHLSPPQRVHTGSSTKQQKNLTISTSTTVQGAYQLVEKTWDHALKVLTTCKEGYLRTYKALSHHQRSYPASHDGQLTVHKAFNHTTAGGSAAATTATASPVSFWTVPGSVAEIENQTRQLSNVMWEHAPSKQLKESKVANFYDYFNRSANPFKTEALENMNTVNACISSLPYPLVLGPHLLFRNDQYSELCVTLNLLTSYMEVLTQVGASVRFAVVLRGTDYESAADDLLFARNVDMLQVALEVLRATTYQSHPLLVFARQRCFATFLSLASTLSQYIPPKSIEKDAFRPLVDFLIDFAQLNVSHLQVLNPTMNVVLCFHDDLVRDAGRLPAVFDLLNTVLHRYKVNAKEQDKEWDAFLTNVNHFFDQYGAHCVAPVYSTLPLLIQRAVELTDFIGVNECNTPLTDQFAALLTTVVSIVRSDAEGKYFHYVPIAPVAALLHTLGSMRHSAACVRNGAAGSAGGGGGEAGSGATYREKAWHVLWNTTLRFVLVLLTLEREFVAEEDIFVNDNNATSWLSSLTGVLTASPRFLHALSGLSGPETDSLYCVWDFREIFLCTQVALVMSTLANPVSVFRMPVQTCFSQFLHYRPARLGNCVSSSAATEVAQAEERLMEEYMVLTVREQLSFFLLQAPLTAVSEAAYPFLAFILQDEQLGTATTMTAGNGVPGTSVRPSRLGYGTCFIGTLTMLCKFIRQQHMYLRNASVASMTPSFSPQAGAHLSEIPSRASFSRASSVTCTPHHTGISMSQRPTDLTATDLNESVATESTYESFTPNTVAQERHARLHSVHVENTQLALNLYCVAVEELLSNLSSQSPLVSQECVNEFQRCTNKLVSILKSMLADISSTGTPFFLADYVARVYMRLTKVVPSA